MSVTLEIRSERYDSAVARRLDAEVQAEYLQRYGGGDATVLAAEDFAPPAGGYFVGYDETGEPVASAAWRSHGDTDAEMKRVYVRADARGRGHARAMVAHVEADARAAGKHRMILETGDGQPEAVALYASLGYVAITPFGYYAGEPGAFHLGKSLMADLSEVLPAAHAAGEARSHGEQSEHQVIHITVNAAV